MRAALGFAAFFGLAAVAIGAWSAHGAAPWLDPQSIGWIHTGVEYQFWHSLALLATAVLMALRPSRWIGWAAIAFGAGIVMFSGSLYALALTGDRVFAVATPLGGVAFMIGWLFLGFHALTLRRSG